MTKKHVNTLIKILLGVACLLFLWFKIHDQFTTEKLDNLKETLAAPGAMLTLVIATLLVIPNWLIESFKWKLITASIEEISFWKALKGVLSGVCVGNLTPGRFGEFAGRIIFFSPHNRAKVSVTHFVCGATQLFTTLCFGLSAAAFWLLSSNEIQNSYYLILSLCGALLLILIIVLFNAEKIYKWLAKQKWLSKLKLGEVSYPRSILLKLLILSIIRYLIFSYQFVLLMQCCGASGSYGELFVPVAIYFMLLSSLPMISFIEVAVRAGVAVILFAPFNSNELLLVSASTLLWVINLVLPSIIGYGFIVNTRIKLRELDLKPEA